MRCREICFGCSLFLVFVLAVLNLIIVRRTQADLDKLAKEVVLQRNAGSPELHNRTIQKSRPLLQRMRARMRKDSRNGGSSDSSSNQAGVMDNIRFTSKEVAAIAGLMAVYAPAQEVFSGDFRLLANDSALFGRVDVAGTAVLKIRSEDPSASSVLNRRIRHMGEASGDAFMQMVSDGQRIFALALALRGSGIPSGSQGGALRGSRVRIHTEFLLLGTSSGDRSKLQVSGQTNQENFPLLWPRVCSLHGSIDGEVGGDRPNTSASSAVEVGRSTGKVGVLISKDCGFTLDLSTTWFSVEDMDRRVIHYAMWWCLLAALQIVSMATPSNQVQGPATTTVGRLSILTVVSQAVIDGGSAILHFVFALCNLHDFNAFSAIAIGKLAMVACMDVPCAMAAWRERHRDLYRGSWQHLRAALTRFYALLCCGMFVSIVFFVLLAVLRFDILSLAIMCFWAPQIWCDALSGAKSNLTPGRAAGLSVARLFEILYVWGCPGNIFAPSGSTPWIHGVPSFWMCIGACLLVAGQLGLMAAQEKFGPRCFVPWFLMTHVYNYHRTIVGKISGEDCAICMSSLLACDTTASKRAVVAPCGHLFHRDCLESWMAVKMECPTCRGHLPPIT